MKICLVTDTFYPDVNGVAVVLKNYVDNLIENGHEVVVIRAKTNKEDKAKEKKKEKEADVKESKYKEVLVYSVQLPKYDHFRLGIPMPPKIAYVLEKEKFDVIYVATEWFIGGLVMNMARLKGVPVVTAYHTNLEQYMSHYGIGITAKAMSLYLGWFHNQANAVIAHSEESRKYLEKIKVKKPVYVLEHGVDTKLFSITKRNLELREKWGVDDNTPVILYVGRITSEKNMQLFFKVLDELKNKSIKFKAVVVGIGPLEEGLRKKYPEVIFTGAMFGEELAEVYASSDIFLFPSLTETFGNVTVEALASGLFSIGFDTAATNKYVIDEKTGLKIEMNSEKEFIDRSISFISNWDRQSVSREEISNSISQISWSNIISQLEDVFKKVIKLPEDKSILYKEIDSSFFKDNFGTAVLKRFFSE